MDMFFRNIKQASRILLFLLIAISSISCKQQTIDGDEYSPHYLDFGLGVRFILDTITISNPLIAVHEDELYIMPEEYADIFAAKPFAYEKNKVFRILQHNVRLDLFDFPPCNESDFTDRAFSTLTIATNSHTYNEYNYSDGLSFVKRVGNIEYYSYIVQPAKFCLELFWFEPEQYRENPYGNRFFILSEIDTVKHYDRLIDSLEYEPIYPKEYEKPRYVMTVEPLYTRETMNSNIIKAESQCPGKPHLIPKWYFKKYCFPDLCGSRKDNNTALAK